MEARRTPPPPGGSYGYSPTPPRRSSNGWKWALGICGVLLALVLVVVGLFIFGVVKFSNDVREEIRENAGVTIPDVVSLTPDEARQKLEAAGFQTNVFTFPDDSVPAGRVVETNPDSGESWPKGWKVTIVVSTGPSG